MIVFGQKCLYSDRNGCIRAKVFVFFNVVVFGQNGCIRAKVVEFLQNGCIRAKVVVFFQVGCSRVKRCCILAEWLYSVKSDFVRVKVVVLWQKLLYKSG